LSDQLLNRVILGAAATEEQILGEHSDLEKDDLRAVYQFAGI
jgi:hypothetical protein